MSTKKIIPIFYASDKNYIPYLAVALTSVKAYASKEYLYKIHVLCSGELDGQDRKIKQMEEENFSIQFIDVGEELNRIRDCMVCRDYYTPAIYYRLLIAELFPQYDKALYLDCDTVALSDVAQLYEIEIGDNYIGAVADQVVTSVPQFCAYTEKALGIAPTRYFNSGVIVMNLAKFREIRFCQQFEKVLRSYWFVVAPDQDVLNLICKDKVYYYEAKWNQMPLAGVDGKPCLVHYNLAMKPWHYDGVLYEEYFWDFANKTEFLDMIKQAKENFTSAMAKRDAEGGEKLIALAQAEADKPNNFIRSVGMQF